MPCESSQRFAKRQSPHQAVAYILIFSAVCGDCIVDSATSSSLVHFHLISSDLMPILLSRRDGSQIAILTPFRVIESLFSITPPKGFPFPPSTSPPSSAPTPPCALRPNLQPRPA